MPYEGRFTGPRYASEFKCSGVLISNRYILTSIYCGSDGFLDSVRIGQYNKRQNVTCEEHPEFKECTEPVIERLIYRKTDIPNTRLLLLAIEKPIEFSDYVRPICLPLSEKQRAKVGDTLATSGWGEEDIQGRNVTIKKKLDHTLLNATFCKDEDPVKNMCLKPKENNTGAVCTGDQGGPIMYQHRHQWFAAGVLHFRYDTEKCSNNVVTNTERLTQDAIDGILDFMFYTGYSFV